MLTKSLLRLLKPGLVDIEPGNMCTRKPELIGNETSRTPDIQYLQATEVFPAKKVPENGQDLSGFAPASLLVEHLGLEFGVRELQRLELTLRGIMPWLALLAGQPVSLHRSITFLSDTRFASRDAISVRDMWWQRRLMPGLSGPD
jgi:hypothetical protein